MNITLHPYSPQEILEEVSRLFSAQARKKQIHYSASIAKAVPEFVIGDALRVRQVLINLVSNSIRFCSEGSDVRVEARSIGDAPGQKLLYVVSDSGAGIPKSAQQRIFEPFGQLDSSASRRYEGTGLGLSISAGLIELMSGSIWVESEEGCGSTFFVELPLNVAEEASRAPDPAEAARSDLNILVVEDSSSNRSLLMGILDKAGYRTIAVNDGAAALERLMSADIDMILLDYNLPGMSGPIIASEIRKREKSKGRHVPIIAMTGDSSDLARHECLSAGMDDITSKPFKAAELLKKIKDWSAPASRFKLCG